jgi:hypothetical protein
MSLKKSKLNAAGVVLERVEGPSKGGLPKAKENKPLFPVPSFSCFWSSLMENENSENPN